MTAAVLARQAGKLPAGIDRWLNSFIKPRTPWWAILQGIYARGFNCVRSDWRRPSRRFDDLPGHIWKGPKTLNLIDTSGSIGEKELDSFAGHLTSIAQVNGGSTTFLCWDSEAYEATPWKPGQPFKFKGGGGTTIGPALRAALKLAGKFDSLVVLTDFYISDSDSEETKKMFERCGDLFQVRVLASIGAEPDLPPRWNVLNIREDAQEWEARRQVPRYLVSITAIMVLMHIRDISRYGARRGSSQDALRD